MSEVRQHYHSIVEELVSFGVDGVELDFFRHPAFFRREEAFTNRYLMTDFIRRCRVSLDAAGAARSPPTRLQLVLRVPDSIALCLSLGLDVGAWIDEGLVDIVAAGGGFVGARGPPCPSAADTPHLRWLYLLRYCANFADVMAAAFESPIEEFVRRAAAAQTPHRCQVILPPAPGVSNEGGSSPLLVLVPAVSRPWVPAWGSLEPPRRDGEHAQK